MHTETSVAEVTGASTTGRSVWAIVAGLLVIFAVSTAVDVVFHATGVFPGWSARMSDGQFALALGYRTIIAIGGCYLTARLAPRRPLLHALILGGIGVLLSAAGAAATWNRPEMGPHWYPLLLVASSMPCAWIGARIQAARAPD